MKESELQDYKTLEELVDMTMQFILSSNKLPELPGKLGIEVNRDPPVNPEVIPIAPKVRDNSQMLNSKAPTPYVVNTGNGKTMAEELKEFKFKATTVGVTPRDFTDNQQRDLQVH